MILPISVIIPTMNRPESLDRTLKSISEATDLPQQIVVVDQSCDASVQDSNRKILQQYSCFISKEYEYQEVASSTKARNLGCLKAINDVIVFSDDDVDVPSDIFTNVTCLMQDNNIAMIAGIDELTQKSKTNIGYFLGTKSFWNRNIGHVTLSMLGRYPDNIQGQVPTQWAQGYFFVVRKSLIDKWAVRWDENLTSYAYAEDLDFSYSYYKCAKAEGLRCILDSRVHVKHLATLEYRVPSVKSIYMYLINRKYLAYKHKMGIKGIIARNWCEWWRLVQKIITGQNPKIFWRAYLCKFMYGKEIISGNLDYDKYMNS